MHTFSSFENNNALDERYSTTNLPKGLSNVELGLLTPDLLPSKHKPHYMSC